MLFPRTAALWPLTNVLVFCFIIRYWKPPTDSLNSSRNRTIGPPLPPPKSLFHGRRMNFFRGRNVGRFPLCGRTKLRLIRVFGNQTKKTLLRCRILVKMRSVSFDFRFCAENGIYFVDETRSDVCVYRSCTKTFARLPARTFTTAPVVVTGYYRTRSTSFGEWIASDHCRETYP